MLSAEARALSSEHRLLLAFLPVHASGSLTASASASAATCSEDAYTRAASLTAVSKGTQRGSVNDPIVPQRGTRFLGAQICARAALAATNLALASSGITEARWDASSASQLESSVSSLQAERKRSPSASSSCCVQGLEAHERQQTRSSARRSDHIASQKMIKMLAKVFCPFALTLLLVWVAVADFCSFRARVRVASAFVVWGMGGRRRASLRWREQGVCSGQM
jgi:hypothetical protein